MSINVFEESVVTLAAAAKLLPRRRRGRSVHPSCIYRWANAGLKGKSGMVVHLETVRVGGTTCTSKEALQRFFDRLQAPSPPEIRPPDLTLHAREARIRQAERELRMAGFEGNARIFDSSTVSKERLCDLDEYIEKKMPNEGFMGKRAYFAVRSGIFEHAARILEGKAGRRRSMEAAKQWIDSLDLLTMDVTQLYGIGPVFESEWKSLIQDPASQALLKKDGGVG
jgi:hypothetical protein